MKEKIYNIPINDAMANAGECPLCFIEKKVEEQALDYVLGSGSSYMEYDTREMTDKAGFCRAHFKKMYDYGNTLGSAWILSTHYDRIIEQMEKQFKDFKPGKGKSAGIKGLTGLFSKKGAAAMGNIAGASKDSISDGAGSLSGYNGPGNLSYVNSIVDWINEIESSCFICDGVNKSFNDYVKVFFSMYKKDADFRRQVVGGQGFCLSHFGVLCEAADKNLNDAELKQFYDELLPLMLENMKRIKGDVAWLIEKFDYRNKDADWKNSKDANQRAMQKLKGGYHHLPAYQQKK